MTIKAIFLPDVLVARPGYSAISVHRALKHIKTVLEGLEPVGLRSNDIQTALDDLEMMILAGANGRDLGEERL